MDYKKKVREQEVEELTEHKNLLEHDLHDISECVDEIQKEKEQVEKERDAVIKKTEVLEKRFSCTKFKRLDLLTCMHVSMDITRKNGCQKLEL